MRLLLHTCCGPCLASCVRGLDAEGIQPALFWYNPNIHPWTEYRARKDCLEGFAKTRGLELIMTDEYGLRSFLRQVYPRPESGPWGAGEGSRCASCYRLRLEAAAEKAREGGYEFFGTTLLASPYQRHDAVRETGEELAKKYGVDFFYRDFRPFFREGQKYAREQGFYMQKYCGCIFSEEERYAL
ncbi:MAG: epoxyqueuosine reductase QueH [Treponema sp.]|jgi:predicted adenine nucleotide alpha hydrolase (AANH) superfamily ATPase|nr:epoxyqueuosine reductase QueH [Treponema sp.]